MRWCVQWNRYEKNLQDGVCRFTSTKRFLKAVKWWIEKVGGPYCVLEKGELSFKCYLPAIPSLDKKGIII